MNIQRGWLVLGLLASGLVLGEPVKASSPMTVSLTCPVDGTDFKVSEAGGMTVMGKRADLSLIGAIGSLYEGHVHSCPKCHFSGTSQDFKQVLTDDLKKLVLEQFANYLPGIRLTSLSEVDLTLQMYAWQQRSPLDFINVALNGSYLANSDDEIYQQKFDLTSQSGNLRLTLRLECLSVLVLRLK